MNHMPEGTLVFLSSTLPSELTIPAELSVIAPRFRRVLYLPSTIKSAGQSSSPLPGNVEVLDTVANARPATGVLDNGKAVARLLGATIRKGNARAYAIHLRRYLGIARHQLGVADALASLVRERELQDAVFYDYWFENSTLALAVLRRRGVIRRAVARAHRFDLYDDPAAAWKVPYREYKARHLDRIVAISRDGAEYVRRRLPRRDRAKVVVSHLGVEVQEQLAPCPGTPVVLSASHMQPFKQVHLIPDVLACVKTPLKWVHFGDGPTMGDARRKAESLPSHVQWEFRGNRPREDVLRLFREEGATLLLSLSASEGLPISMMEAASFGVPVVAYGVCGIPDLVNEKTGRLLDPSWPLARIAEEVEGALVPGTFSRKDIAAYQRDHFNLSRNYESFANLLTSL